VLLARLGTDHSTGRVIDALKDRIQTLPAQPARSPICDHGKELAAHKTFTVQTRVDVCFCDPHSPWRRGSNENTNGRLRKTLARKTPAEQINELLR
jgi:IS30 family transposase